MGNKINALIVFLCLIFCIFAGCTTNTSTDIDNVSVRLKWLHQTQFSGFYVAEKEGYYANENLEVTFEEINLSNQDAISYILSGKNDICIASGDEVIIHCSDGNEVIAIAVIYQIVPIVYISYEKTGIVKPSDLINKTVALSTGQATYLYEAMLKQQKVNRSQITEISPPSYNFIENLEVADVSVDYATNGLARAKYEGLNVTALWPKDYGVPFYGDVIVVTKDFLNNNSDIIKRFLQATINGWEKAIENPDLAVEYVLEYNPSLEQEFQMEAMYQCIPLVDTGENSIGLMRHDIWIKMYDILYDQNIIDNTVDIATVFTNDFL